MKSIHTALVFIYIFTLGSSASIIAGEIKGTPRPEPNVKIASQWWPEFENVWTPIGWKDHQFRANVIYNGTLFVTARDKAKYGTGIQLEFIPSINREIPKPLDRYFRYDSIYGPVGNQGWKPGAAPVLWTEWDKEGVTFRKEIFGHLSGGGDVGKDAEPLYLWIRLSVSQISDKKLSDKKRSKLFWIVKINKSHLTRQMRRKGNLVSNPKVESQYPHKLKLASNGEGIRLLEQKGVTLGITPDSQCDVEFISPKSDEKNVYLRIEVPARKGASVDLLLPAIPSETIAFEKELALGHQQALAQTERYWSQIPNTAATFETPESLVNDTISNNLKFVELLSVRMPKTGEYCQLSGSGHYESLWPTPTSMTHTMLLDDFGYHSVSEKYLEIFRNNQGKRVPPSTLFKKPHPGYLSSPQSMSSIDWLSDHGAILFAVSNHALMTDDKKFIARWQAPIIKACDFIKESLAMEGHEGEKGILPPAIATDLQDQVQAVWSDGWNYKALTTAVRLLKRLNHPRAEEFAKVAAKYKKAHNEAFRKSALKLGKWTDNNGKKHQYTPTLFFGDRTTSSSLRSRKPVPFQEQPFYLDTGPMFMVYSGLMDANDPLMKESLEFFRNGPHQFKINGDFNVPPLLHHEMSSCEPCYSWNVFHSHQTRDRYRYLEGMYSLFTGGLSRQTFISSETRGGISGTVFTAPLATHLARLAVIDDKIEPDNLHLLRLAPLAWIKNDKPTKCEEMPTEFGPVTLLFKLSKNREILEVDFTSQFRHPPKQVLLHVPPIKNLKQVTINGKSFNAKQGDVLKIK